MKKFSRRSSLFFLLAGFILISACSSSKKVAATKPASTTEEKVTQSVYAGTWAFDVKGTPDGDVKGDMIISQNGEALKGVVSTGGAQSEIQNLKIVNNQLTGIFYYNGTTVNMSGSFNSNSYDGKVEAEGYTFPMSATKK